MPFRSERSLGEPMDLAWRLLKSQLMLYPPEKNYLGQFGNSRPGGVTMNGTPYTLLPNQTANVTNPFSMNPPLNPTEKEQMDLQHGVMETDVHEDIHGAMHSIGEVYDNPVQDEFPAVLAGALQFSRRPKELMHPKDKMIPELESGKDPRLIAIEHAKRFAPRHTQASGHVGPMGIHRIGFNEKPRTSYD